MAFTEAQVKGLEAKLSAKRIKTRQANGVTLAYVEGWHVIAEANRIFGYDAWDRRTRTNSCVWTGTKGGFYHAAYTAKVRVTLRAGDTTIVREGSGTGEGKALSPGQAHELALKAAETDATKRALATFGNPFGLALYDHEQAGVRKVRNGKASSAKVLGAGPWILRSATGVVAESFDKADEFAEGLREAMREAQDIELLFAIWEQNVETVRDLNKCLKQDALPRSGIAPQLVAHLKHCASALVKPGNANDASQDSKDGEVPRRPNQGLRSKIDKSVLTISEPKRHRSKEHLRFVAQQPCLVCGRSPTHAHHVRFAQSKGLGLKVSDEFTVPLCAIHHQQNHATGNERMWWQERKLDPLPVAHRLWQESCSIAPSSNTATTTSSVESSEKKPISP
jgi:DNA recombination protein Rad52